MGWLERLCRWWDPSSAIIDEALLIKVGDLDRDVSMQELHLLCNALEVTTWNNYRHVFGRQWSFDTRVSNIDALLVMLFDVVQNISVDRPYDLIWPEDQISRCTLYDFMSTERGFSIPITDAVARTLGLIQQFLGHLDAMSLESDQSFLDYHVRKTQLLRQHLANVMWLLIVVGDQTKMRGS